MSQPISKDEYRALLVDLQDRQMKSSQEMLASIMAELTKVLREINGPEIALGPSPEQIAEQQAEQRKRMRDGFAAAALHGLLAGDTDVFNTATAPVTKAIASLAYEYADAMLAKREE